MAFVSIQRQAEAILAKAGAVITGSHVVYTSGKHGSAYVNKDAVYTNPEWLDQLASLIAERFYDVDVVVAPAIGAVKFEAAVTRKLRVLSDRDVRGVYAEHDEESVAKGPNELHHLDPGEELLIKKPQFVIKRGYDKLVAGKRVLVVEDVLTTGNSARETVRAAKRAGGEVTAVAALCNRGGVAPAYLEVPKLFSLVEVTLDAYDEDKCPLCAQGVPVNTMVGKGKQFLARKSQPG